MSQKSKSKSSSNLNRIEFNEPDSNRDSNHDNSVELDELRTEIAKLKQRIDHRNLTENQAAFQPKPIIKTPVQSDSETKQIKLFSKLKHEVQKLRNEVMLTMDE